MGSGLLHAAVPARSTAATFGVSGVPFSARGNFAVGLRGAGFGPGFGLRGRGFLPGRLGGFGLGFRRGPWFGFGFFELPFYGYPLGLNSCIWGPNWFGAGFGYDPFWYGFTPCYGPWGIGLNSPSYYNPYPNAGTYVYGDDPNDDSDYSGQGDAPPNFDQNALTDQNEPNASEAPAPDSGAVRANVQLYLKNGGVFNVILYWVTGDKLNYVTDNGSSITIELDQLDLPRTISENAKRGMFFKLPGQPADQTSPAPANTPARDPELKAKLATPQ